MRSELRSRENYARLQIANEYRAKRVPVTPRPIHQVHKIRTPRAARDTTPLGGVWKRGFDILGSLGLLTMLAPFLLLVFLLVRVTSPGPGLFRQPRGGMGGKEFNIYNFRTMAVCEISDITQATRSDPRVTRIGRFLRASSIDELPQLLNVLKGDMSLVGPRPHALVHDKQFEEVDQRYCWRRRARPGITGLAQVSGSRGPTETSEKVRKRVDHDVDYIVSWSLMLDIRILLQTAMLAFRDKNAF